jgi:hypothetical protein
VRGVRSESVRSEGGMSVAPNLKEMEKSLKTRPRAHLVYVLGILKVTAVSYKGHSCIV